MAILKPKEARLLSREDRQKRLQQLKAEYSKEISAVASGTRPENPGRIKEIRRTIARIITIEHETKAAKAATAPAKKAESPKAKATVAAKPATAKPVPTKAPVAKKPAKKEAD